MILIKKIAFISILFCILTLNKSFHVYSQETKENNKNTKENSSDENLEPFIKPKIVWSTLTGSNSFAATTPIIINDFILFAGSQTIHCVNKKDGTIVWQVNGKFYHSMPSCWQDKVVAVADKGIQLINLKTGKIEDIIDFSTPNDKTFLADSNPVIENDFCYIGTRSNHLVKIDLKKKEIIWKSDTKSKNIWTPTIMGNKAAVAVWGESLCVFNTVDGKLIWEKPLKGIGASAPIIQKDLVICGGENGLILAFNLENGEIAWTKNLEGGKDQSCLGLLGTEEGIIMSTKSRVINIDPSDGKINWEYPINRFGYQNFTSDKKGNLFIGSDSPKFIVLKLKDGKLQQSINLMDFIEEKYKALEIGSANGVKYKDCGSCSTPIIESNFAYALTTGGLAVCFQLPPKFLEN